MDLQEELKVLKQRIAELECHDKKQKFPQDGDKYWYVDDIGLLWLSVFGKGELSNDRVEMGNVFRTKEEAGFVAEKLKVEAELRKYSRPFKKGEQNWIILFDSVENHIEFSWTGVIFYAGVVYFENETEASKAIRSVGEERIKKYIFGVED